MRDDATLWPTHGGPIRDPKPFLEAYIAHRLAREAPTHHRDLHDGIETTPACARLYVDVDTRLHPAAARSVLAHLIQMIGDGHVLEERRDGIARYRLSRPE